MRREEPANSSAQKNVGRRSWRRLSVVLGLLLLAVLIAAGFRLSEGRDFVRLLEQAEPWWLLLAFAVQAGTYVAQSESWRAVARAARFPLPILAGSKLSLAKLFVDHTLPTGGISGTVVVARALERMGMPRGAVMASVVVTIASNQAAFVASLAAGLTIAAIHGQVTALIVLLSVVILLFGALLALGVVALSGRGRGRLARGLSRLPPLRTALEALAEADPGLARRPGLLLEASGCQLAVILLDAATLWVLLRALGVTAAPAGVFASFIVSSVFRTIGVLPGGLGTFDAASVLTLRLAGIPIAAALSATLLFRGLSSWLPMLPGWWISRRLVSRPLPKSQPEIAEGYWALPVLEVARRLDAPENGLSSAAASERLLTYGPNELRARRPLSRLGVLLNQLRSPLLLLLIFAAGAAILTREWLDAVIVLAVIVASVGISYSREYSAQTAAAALQARLVTRATVLRDGRPTATPLTSVVPGDIVLLQAGSLVPGDGVILEATDFYVSEAVLTGESFPVEKKPGVVAPAAALVQRTNCVFLGTNVRSGTARCLVVRTGTATEFGAIAHRLTLRPPETEFDRGTRRFGYFLTTAMLVMMTVVFVAHASRGRPPVETLLFALALAVGLSPELLPAILSLNLARGARIMAQRGVLVRRLNAIENLGSMDVLCTDKTGTLTEGVVHLGDGYDEAGQPSAQVVDLGTRNAALETGLTNPLDEAILAGREPDLSGVQKLAEIPFDFVRKRVSVIVEDAQGVHLIAKGAFAQMIEVCSRSRDGHLLDQSRLERLQQLFDAWSDQGIRVLAVATRDLERKSTYSRQDERDLTFSGFLTFLDRPKEGVGAAVADLGRLGVAIKLITGDSKRVAQHVASLVGMRADRLLTGGDLDRLHDEALWHVAERTDLFAEVDPNQKERIILALKKTGHVVGFLGDGVNDAPAMHAADTSLSVDQAVDVAREAADFVLLERDLDVIRGGIAEGRRTFANTLKYVQTTTSANLGNMLSMAAASLFLPFLPLLPGQILLNNFLSDIPAIGIADDSVDPELVDHPRRWDIRFIGHFMIEFGMLSSAFDILTFVALLGVFRAGPEIFRTGWFVESLLTELVIALVVRTGRPFYRSRPGTLLLTSTAALIVLAFAIPYLPAMNVLGFVPLPLGVLGVLSGVTVLYVLATEVAKRRFYRRVAFPRVPSTEYRVPRT
ncbi:MAG TPA: magnesium-translocating P-type ATPase [Gemmatimonadales bacterium]|jgi:Mg2+-importing ATPase